MEKNMAKAICKYPEIPLAATDTLSDLAVKIIRESYAKHGTWKAVAYEFSIGKTTAWRIGHGHRPRKYLTYWILTNEQKA
jgi:hypothetical protein